MWIIWNIFDVLYVGCCPQIWTWLDACLLSFKIGCGGVRLKHIFYHHYHHQQQQQQHHQHHHQQHHHHQNQDGCLLWLRIWCGRVRQDKGGEGARELWSWEINFINFVAATITIVIVGHTFVRSLLKSYHINSIFIKIIVMIILWGSSDGLF